MRFTKIPLIATLMAVALSLLIVLPGLAQQADITDGKLANGVVTAGVYANIADAELDRLKEATGTGAEPDVFVLIDPQPPTPKNGDGAHAPSDRAHLVSDESSPRDTLFRNTLYVSNDMSAYNTILINVKTDNPTCNADDDTKPSVTATVKNNRSGRSVTLQLVQSSNSAGNSQGFIKVVGDGDMAFVTDVNGDIVSTAGKVALMERDGPTWCDGADETEATTAGYYPVSGAPLARQEIATIFADHGDRLTITTTGGSGVIELVVDGDGPEFTAVTPDDNAVLRPNRLTFSFEVRDDDSGLRHDGESIISPDGDRTEINPDGDHALHSEPLSENPGTAVRSNGKSADIDVDVAPNPRSGAAPDYEDISASGTWSMAGNRAGVAYAFTASGADRDDAYYLYRLVATDRAGNTAMTDADSDTDMEDPYVFRVDDTEPDLTDVRTGITWNSEDDEEEVDRSYIALTFSGGDAGADALGDVDTDNITVVGHTIVGVVHPSERPAINRNTAMESDTASAQFKKENPGTDIEGNPIREPRSRVYLELSEDLAADATPDVVVVGGAVFDLAGNTNEAKTEEAEDWIAPSLSVTVTGAANDRPIVNEDGSFTVDVRSDEDLRRRPVVFFVKIEGEQTAGKDTDATADDKFKYTIMDVDEASPLTQQEDENHWSKKYKRSSIDIDVTGGEMIGVVVLGHDGQDNSGATAGWKPAMHQDAGNPADGNTLALPKMDAAGLLVEIDEQFNNGGEDSKGNALRIGEVTPRSDDDGEETESANPFVKLTFDGEADEYRLLGFKGADSHGEVKVTEITLNGDDVMANLNRVSATQFSLVLRDLEVDTYKVEYVAEDQAGNEMDDGEFSFEVKARQPYKIDVQPGWNLISLPATPVNPAIGDVLAHNQYISPVLGYQEGDWITAIREEDGTWRGRLTEVVGGYGYWVHARTFESVKTMLSEVDPAGTLPTVPVTAGWNLLGVLDIFQNGMGDPPGVKNDDGEFTFANYEADNYFSSITWKVAYTYDTRHSLWVKTTPDDPDESETAEEPTADEEILNGKGYWVWSTAPSTLVP